MLTYRRTDELEVIGYSDLDFPGCVDSCKSTSRYIFMFVGEAISWRSGKQTLLLALWRSSLFPILRLPHIVYDLRVSSLGLELWILFLSH